jgi:anti-sigma B factor antagonist
MDISLETRDGVTVARLVGRWDANTAPDIEAAIMPQIGPGCRVLLDLTGVPYMSSAGLRTLLLLYRGVEDNQGRIALAGLGERLRDTMAVTGFLHHFDLYDTVADGLAALRA